MSETAQGGTDTTLRRALHVARGAYADAMREHGLLPGTITLIEIQAEQNLEGLIAADEDEPP